MSKHTPGPWQSLPEECDKPYIRIRGTVFGGRYKIANVITPSYEGVHEREAVETRANARLIAAAPELLDFAKEWLARQGSDNNYMTEKARAAIAKAEGV